MTNRRSRREFIRHAGISAAAAPFILNLPSLGFANSSAPRKQRLVVLFSPNGVVPWNFWPKEQGDKFTLPESVQPLAPYQDRALFLKGVSEKIQGDGDRHMRGMGCLLTGIELFPGNIQGGSDTPAGWASGHSIDQEIKRYLQAKPETRTRFGSLEFGVLVPDRADTWTRMVYAGPNKPIAPIDDPYQMFDKLYGRMKNTAGVRSILDSVTEDLRKVRAQVSAADRKLLDDHATFVREMEQELQRGDQPDVKHAVPEIEPGVREENDNLPKISKLQIDLMVNSFQADFTRLATLQYTNSVGQAKMTWLGIDDKHHDLSHKPDKDEDSQEKLTRINRWFCEQMAYLVKRLAETPEADGSGTLLDNTTVIWTNELGQGNNHTLNNVPFVLVGGGLGFQMGRSLQLSNVPHHRLLLSLAHAFGHRIEKFGNANFCGDGPLDVLTG